MSKWINNHIQEAQDFSKKCEHRDGESVSAHVMKRKNLIENLNKLEMKIDNNLVVDIILESLSYQPFIMQFTMNDVEMSIQQLHNILQRA